MKRYLALLFVLAAMPACEPWVETFDETMPCQYYEARVKKPAPAVGSTLLVMTWNMRFGWGKVGWFGDSCGDRVIMGEEEVFPTMQQIAGYIDAIKPDVLLLQEVDIDSKRSGYVDQMQYLLDSTYLNYGVYASNWKSQFIPSDGLGRMDEGNAILSPWPIDDAVRYQLPLRNDLDNLTRLYYVRENVMTARVNVPGVPDFYAACTHLAAFSTDDTKQRQLDECLVILKQLDADGKRFVVGGDFNLLPPNATKTDYCLEKMCPDEHFHGPDDDPYHNEGANYTPEITWLNPLYDQFFPSLTLEDYIQSEAIYFTNTQLDGDWDSTLDYLFSNTEWQPGSHQAHQENRESDHCPVTAQWIIQH